MRTRLAADKEKQRQQAAAAKAAKAAAQAKAAAEAEAEGSLPEWMTSQQGQRQGGPKRQRVLAAAESCRHPLAAMMMQRQAAMMRNVRTRELAEWGGACLTSAACLLTSA